MNLRLELELEDFCVGVGCVCGKGLGGRGWVLGGEGGKTNGDMTRQRQA